MGRLRPRWHRVQPKPVMLKTFNAAGCPLVDTKASFRAPCTYGDEVTITTSVVDLRNSSFDIHHELKKGDRLCVESFDTRVWTIHHPETGRLKSAAIPDEVVARFRAES